jgi:hypothetical protein
MELQGEALDLMDSTCRCRYCNHDVGHAIGAVAIAAASLGWNTCMLDGYSGHELGSLFGLPHVRASTDRGPAKGVMRELEAEHADCVIAVFPSGEFVDITLE